MSTVGIRRVASSLRQDKRLQLVSIPIECSHESKEVYQVKLKLRFADKIFNKKRLNMCKTLP